MYPELFTIDLPMLGTLPITSFGVSMAAAFGGAYLVLRSELTRRDGAPELADGIMLAGLVGGIVGAKLYFALLHWERTAADPAEMIFSRGGLVWYGGFIGGALAVFWLLKRRGAPLLRTIDCAAPALAIGYCIGRIGCFLVGDDYGYPTDGWTAVAFPDGAPPTTAANLRAFGADVDPAIPGDTVLAVHPTQLYEAGLMLIVFLVLMRLSRGPVRPPGWLFAAWLAMAGVERILIEFFRAKDDRFLGPFTLAQFFSVLAVAGAVWALAHLRNTRSTQPAPTG
ncbi:MAG: prolipoprotein diacylglyceryl transferase [Gemmatimonadetes bacterium]|nr:prolipoprotein diacylglyceryl transferase [Gemmatimonadota bacterium]